MVEQREVVAVNSATGQRPDRRIRRTRAALQEALIELMTEKGYDAVTVQDIIDRADVGRSTFYAHFTDKEDLLVSGIENLRSQVPSGLSASTDRERFAFSLELFRHARGQRRLYRSLVGRRGGAVVLRWFTQMVSDTVREELGKLPPREGGLIPLDVTVQFVTGAYMSVLTWWVDSGAKHTPEEMDRMFRTLATGGLATALKL
jgi:AcrR family transcriptional regulator